MNAKHTKRIITLLLMVLAAVVLASCAYKTVEVPVTLKNATPYVLETVIFDIAPKTGTTSPMHELITTVDDALQPGEEREVAAWILENTLGEEGWTVLYVEGDEELYRASGRVCLEKGTNQYEITCDDDMKFTVTAIQ